MLKMTVTFYEHDANFKTDYSKPHNYEITGTAAECMHEFLLGQIAGDHDLSKYTPRHITYIEEI